MKLKTDMSGGERYAWATLIATGIVGFHFYGRMFDGLSVANLGATDLLGVYLRVIITFIILHIVIAIVFAAKRKKASGDDYDDDNDLFERDERDNAIERKGQRVGFWILGIFVEIAIFMLLFENAYPERYEPPLSVTSTSGMFFILMSAVLLADFISRAVMIKAYRS